MLHWILIKLNIDVTITILIIFKTYIEESSCKKSKYCKVGGRKWMKMLESNIKTIDNHLNRVDNER